MTAYSSPDNQEQAHGCRVCPECAITFDSEGIHAFLKFKGVVQLETCGEDDLIIYSRDDTQRWEKGICLSRDTARHLAQDILHHIELMEEMGRKEEDDAGGDLDDEEDRS